MRIGIDLSVLKQSRTGIGNYAFNLSQALPKRGSGHEFIFFGGPKGAIPFFSRHVSYARQIQKENLDVFHGPANVLPLGFPYLTSLRRATGDISPRQGRVAGTMTRSVITLHDLAIYRHPEWFPKGQWLATKLIVPATIRKASKIIAPSQATKKDLIELFRVPGEKIIVIPHGVEPRFFKESGISNSQFPILNQFSMSKFSKPYILFVGTLEPRKNIERIVDAYADLPKDILERYDLVLAGRKGWNDRDILLKIGKEKIKVLPDITNDQLPELYQNAALFVYPSLYEGFGLPILEAMAAGAPVITSNTSSMPEVAAGAAITINPLHTGEISGAIEKILRDPALVKQLSEDGVSRARHFTWGETAKRTLSVYESLS